jgi:hypothetical protein
VQSTADKIMTCFLAFGPGVVMAHDLIHIHEGDAWKLLQSCYPKLRLSAHEACQELQNAGFKVHAEQVLHGMTLVAAQRACRVCGCAQTRCGSSRLLTEINLTFA